MAIHPTAIVHTGADLHPSVEVGPYCVVGPKVRIGENSRLVSHVVIDNHTTLGARNTVYPFASLGGAPQDLKFKGEPARLILGNDNTIRESATLNIGTAGGHMETRVGDGCLFMAYSHVGHDSIIGNRVVLANSVGIAGHVTIHDFVIVGGIAGVHQYCVIGRNAFIAGAAMVAQNVPPFCIAHGDRAELAGINVIGLRRAGWSRERINGVREAFRRLFLSESTRMTALERTESDLAAEFPEVAEMCQFIRVSKRGVCPPRLGAPLSEGEES